MRSNPWVTLGIEQVQSLLSACLPKARVKSVEALPGGHCNTSYKVLVEGALQPLVLRIFTHDPAGARRQISLLRHVRALAPVPEILHFSDRHAWLPYPYAIMTCVEGAPLERVLPILPPSKQREVGRAVGRTLARLGKFTFEGTGTFDDDLRLKQVVPTVGDLWQAIIGGALFEGRLSQRIGRTLSNRLWSMVEASKPLLDTLPHANALVHGDFNSKNILVHPRAGGWGVSAVLDWDCAYAGSPMADLANLFAYQGNVSPVFESGVLEAFTAAGGALPAEWRRVASLLDLITVVEFLNQRSERPRAFEEAKRQLERAVLALSRIACAA